MTVSWIVKAFVSLFACFLPPLFLPPQLWRVELSWPPYIWLDCRWGETRRSCRRRRRTIKGTAPPHSIPCVPTAVEHFGAVWSPRHGGEDRESFQWASPHSAPSSPSLCTLLIFPPSEDCRGSEMWEDEKSQPAVKPKSNIWAWNRREHLSAVDSLFSANIKSRCQREHEQEIALLVKGREKKNRKRLGKK